MVNTIAKRTTKGLFLFLIMMVATALALSACTSSKPDQGQPDSGKVNSDGGKADGEKDVKPVTLRWVFPGPGKQKDSEEVWAEFNKRLQEVMPGTTIQFEAYPVAEYADNWKLLAASGEKIDLAWMGYVQDVAAEVNKGSYMELDELLQASAPNIVKELPEWLLDLAKFNGKLYGIPNYQIATDVRLGLRVPKEFVDANYIDVKQAQETFYKYGPIAKESYDVMEQYLAKLKEKGQLRQGASTFSIGFAPSNHGTIGSHYLIKGDLNDINSLYVANIYDTPEMKMAFDVAADWFKKGYIRKDILSLQNPRTDEGKPDGYVTWIHNYIGDQSATESARYGFPIEVIPMEQDYVISRPIYTTMTAIARTSKNPERALEFLELMNTEKGKELYNLLVWGIEGKHYKKLSDTRIETIGYAGQGTADSNYGLWKWVMGNTANSYETQADPEGYNELWKKINESAMISPVLGFKPDSEPVKTEIAQVAAVVKEFSVSLQSGALPDHEQTYKDFIEKMKKAGSDTVVQVYQKQLDEFVKNKK